MQRKKVEVGVLNIVLNPHPPGIYQKLFEAVRKKRIKVNYHGTSGAQISYIDLRTDLKGNVKFIKGVFYKFTNINKFEAWYNTETNEVADESLVSQIVIPDNLKPNAESFQFEFVVNSHLLFYQANDRRTLSAKTATQIFDRLFNHELLKEEFGFCKVTHEPDPVSIERIFGLKSIRKLELEINRPNPDSFRRASHLVSERMKERNVNKTKTEYISYSGNLSFDDDLKNEMKIAAENGTVHASGQDSEGKKVDIVSKNNPLRKHAFTSSKLPTIYSAFDFVVREIKQTLKIIQA